MIESLGRLGWQEACGYGTRALVETTMGRYKAIIGARLRARDWRANVLRQPSQWRFSTVCWVPDARTPSALQLWLHKPNGVGVISPAA